MKLLNITNRFYIIVALALLLLSSIFFAYGLIQVIDAEYTEHLLFTKAELEKQIADQPELQHRSFVVGDQIRVDTISKFTTFKVKIKDTSRYDAFEESIIPFRSMTYEQQIKDCAYRITITQRMTESSDYYKGVSLTLIVIALDIIACFYFLNRYFSNNIWRPFYSALNKLKRFDLHKGQEVSFPKSRISEFNTLNEELKKLMDKVSDDYQNLKEFTENMSHETQTPLAIIRSKLELLLQSENLHPDQITAVYATLEAVNRLSKMNRGLILLTRIDNEQFTEEQEMHLSKVIGSQLELLDSFIQSRGIHLEFSPNENLKIMMNPYLADILVSNLLSNAIKYNVENGKMKITFSENALTFANSGTPMSVDGHTVFERFRKGQSKAGIGMGLSIVKRIADFYHFQPSYKYEDGMHYFTICFNGLKQDLGTGALS